MKVVYKYTIEVAEFQVVDMPSQAKILSAQVQHGQIRLWALCDPAARIKQRRVLMFGTGQPFNGLAQGFVYIDTVQVGVYVWHVFAENEYLYFDP